MAFPAEGSVAEAGTLSRNCSLLLTQAALPSCSISHTTSSSYLSYSPHTLQTPDGVSSSYFKSPSTHRAYSFLREKVRNGRRIADENRDPPI